MSGTFPSTPAPSAFDPSSNSPARISIAQNLKVQVRTTGAQRFGGTLSWEVATRVQMAPIIAFLMAQDGQAGNFQIVLPTPFDVPQGSWAGTPVVDGASQAGSAIALRGFTPSASGVCKAGDVFKFAGDTKVYMVTADANASGAGKATVSIKPKLMLSPADGEALTFTAVPFTMMQAGDLVKWSVRPPALFGWSLDLIEYHA